MIFNVLAVFLLHFVKELGEFVEVPGFLLRDVEIRFSVILVQLEIEKLDFLTIKINAGPINHKVLNSMLDVIYFSNGYIWILIKHFRCFWSMFGTVIFWNPTFLHIISKKVSKEPFQKLFVACLIKRALVLLFDS